MFGIFGILFGFALCLLTSLSNIKYLFQIKFLVISDKHKDLKTTEHQCMYVRFFNGDDN